MLPRDELADYGYTDDLYLLATDTAVVVPTGKTVVMQVTGADVIHSWTIPAFGVKQDAVPGRLAELWFTVEEGMEGVYFGQCSELCGKDHAYMPITVKAVSQEAYDAWLTQAVEEYAGKPRDPSGRDPGDRPSNRPGRGSWGSHMTDIRAYERTAPQEAGFGDYFALLKPRVMSLVVFTALVGLVVAPVPVHPVVGSPRSCSSPSAAAPRARSTCGGTPISTG
jgi:hypothetical protein